MLFELPALRQKSNAGSEEFGLRSAVAYFDSD